MDTARNLWQQRLQHPSRWMGVFWNIIYGLGRFFSLFSWNPLAQTVQEPISPIPATATAVTKVAAEFLETPEETPGSDALNPPLLDRIVVAPGSDALNSPLLDRIVAAPGSDALNPSLLDRMVAAAAVAEVATLVKPLPPEAQAVADPNQHHQYNELFTRPKSNTALVVGASADQCEPGGRWYQHFHPTVCSGLPNDAYIVRNISWTKKNNVLELMRNPLLLLQEMLSEYQKNYAAYMAQHFKQQKFTTIIFDRCMQGLVIDNPIQVVMLEPVALRRDAYVLLSELMRQRFWADDQASPAIPGAFNEHLFCLLCLNFLSTLQAGGTLIVDTQFMAPAHVQLLTTLFQNSQLWDSNSEQNRALDYYANGRYGPDGPTTFMAFSGYKNQVLNFNEYQQQLLQLSFPVRDASLEESQGPAY
ncbi:MAG: hypothetical protein ACHP65_03805 [Legionellales bacterium]